MAVLLDSNILLRLAQPHHPQSPVAARAVRNLRATGESLYITQQNLVEFWVVVTRPPVANGLGLTIEQALAEIHSVRRLFALHAEVPLHDIWERLARDYRISGKNAHDARLVAAMVAHGIESLLTFNVQDSTLSRDSGDRSYDLRISLVLILPRETAWDSNLRLLCRYASARTAPAAGSSAPYTSSR
jgi:predicted nucleic acid-binding protein